jgi:hypothetical protein
MISGMTPGLSGFGGRRERSLENPKAKHDSSSHSGEQMMVDSWRSVLAQMTDEDLEDRLFTYFWRAMKTPNSHSYRLRDLVDEAERRGLAAWGGPDCVPPTSLPE